MVYTDTDGFGDASPWQVALAMAAAAPLQAIDYAQCEMNPSHYHDGCPAVAKWKAAQHVPAGQVLHYNSAKDLKNSGWQIIPQQKFSWQK